MQIEKKKPGTTDMPKLLVAVEGQQWSTAAFRCVSRMSLSLSKASCHAFRTLPLKVRWPLLSFTSMCDAPAIFGRDMCALTDFARVWLGRGRVWPAIVREFDWGKLSYSLSRSGKLMIGSTATHCRYISSRLLTSGKLCPDGTC
jgi:hypothetical protein